MTILKILKNYRSIVKQIDDFKKLGDELDEDKLEEKFDKMTIPEIEEFINQLHVLEAEIRNNQKRRKETNEFNI